MKNKILFTVSILYILSIIGNQNIQAMDLPDDSKKKTYIHPKQHDENDEQMIAKLPDSLKNNPEALLELHRSSVIINDGVNSEGTVSQRLIKLSNSSIDSPITPEEARIKTTDIFSTQKERESLFNKARAGDAKAQFAVGLALGEGWGTAQDPDQAVRWLKKAKKRGIKEAQGLLAAYYLDGRVRGKQPADALPLLFDLSDQGFPEVEYCLGVLYHTGEAVNKDYVQAMNYYRKAAVGGGNVNAHYGIGVLYYNGLGVPQDIQKAKTYFEMAAAQGHQPAIQALQQVKTVENLVKWCTIL